MARTVARLMVSEDLFRLAVGSVARVSLLNRRFETANGLIQAFLSRDEPLKPAVIDELRAMTSLVGEIPFFVRLTDVGDRTSVLKAMLSEALGYSCTLREIVAYACLEWSQLPPLTIGRG